MGITTKEGTNRAQGAASLVARARDWNGNKRPGWNCVHDQLRAAGCRAWWSHHARSRVVLWVVSSGRRLDGRKPDSHSTHGLQALVPGFTHMI